MIEPKEGTWSFCHKSSCSTVIVDDNMDTSSPVFCSMHSPRYDAEFKDGRHQICLASGCHQITIYNDDSDQFDYLCSKHRAKQ